MSLDSNETKVDVKNDEQAIGSKLRAMKLQ